MKNTFSFRHDYGARNDPKIRRMVNRLGAEAGWAWWIIVEELYEQGGRLPLDAIPDLAYDAHVSEEVIEKVIRDFGLFKIERKEFYSERICWELSDKEDKSSAAKKSAAARWDKYKKDKELGKNKDASASNNDANAYTNAQKSDTETDTLASKIDAKIKGSEIKGSEIKGSEDIDADASSSGEPENGVLFPGMATTPEPEIDPREVFNMWNNIIDETQAQFPKLKLLTESKRTHIKARLQEFKKYGEPLEIAEQVIRKACTSKFLNGQRWANFKWIFCFKDNWDKIYEGDYDDRPSTPAEYDRLHIPATSPEAYEEDF